MGKRLYDSQNTLTITNTLRMGKNATMTTVAADGTESTVDLTELGILDGLTATTAELNILDGVTSTAAELNILDGVTSTAAELNQLDGNILNTLATEAGTGITGGSGTVYASSVTKVGGIYHTQILLDLTGLRSTAAGDIIGVDGTANPCHIGQITAARNGTGIMGTITCLEAPVGGDPDIDLYSATEATGAEDTAISTLTETELVDSGDHSLGSVKVLTAFPAADEYLYLVAGATTDADYSAGKLLIDLWGT